MVRIVRMILKKVVRWLVITYQLHFYEFWLSGSKFLLHVCPFFFSSEILFRFMMQLVVRNQWKSWCGTRGYSTPSPRSNPLPIYIPFWQQRNLFRIPSINKSYPFHIPSLEIKFALIKINHKTRTFSPLFLSHKMRLWALWALLQTEMSDVPTLSYTSNSEIHIVSYTRGPEKGTPLGRSPPGVLQGSLSH